MFTLYLIFTFLVTVLGNMYIFIHNLDCDKQKRKKMDVHYLQDFSERCQVSELQKLKITG